MEALKKFVIKLISVLIINGGLFVILPSIFYVIGLLYWQGLLSTLGLEYSFIRMDSYVFYIDGGFIFFNSVYKVSIYICLTLYSIGIFLFLFSDLIYLVLEKIKPKLKSEKIKFKITQFYLFLMSLILLGIVMLSLKIMANSYMQGVSFAEKTIGQSSDEQLDQNKGKSEIVKQQIIKLKNNDVILGRLVGCSQEHCIIYSENKVLTIEKNKIESQVTEFKSK